MELLLQRFSGGGDDTLGILLETKNDAPLFLCFTLEDEHRDVKVRGETRIPAGRYRILLRKEGGMHPRYAQRYDFHRGMLWLQDVPNFQWIYIHPGNDHDDTLGCLLTGDTCEQNVTENGRLGAPRAAYARIYPRIAEAIEAAEEVWITVCDEQDLISQQEH